MRQVLTGLAAALLTFSAVPARAQQGSVELTAAGQVVTGDPQRLAGQTQLEPDLGLRWLQPGAHFGIFQLEVRAARHGDQLHLGRAHAALRDVKYRGVAWSFEAGDTFFSPAIGEYRAANLFTPAVMFTGASVSGRTRTSTVTVIAGRASAWRNIFGSDPETLDQSIGYARITHRFGRGLDVNARASRIRTTDLQEFSYTIDASDQAGGGINVAVLPSLYVVADASLVSYRRAGATTWQRDPSWLAGASWLHKRGWIQVNASRFSPGEFPVLNYALQDRDGLFAAGDIDLLPRVRVSGGWDLIRTNLDPIGSLEGTRPPPRGTSARQFAAVRVQLTSRSTFTVRGEQGDRRSQPVRFGGVQDSDTGAWTAEWQTAVGRFNSFARYARRENVDHLNAPASSTQHDTSVLAFLNASHGTQLFGSVMLTRNTGTIAATTYWQAGGGAQLQIPRHDLWFRAEGTVARNVDVLAQSFVPRESLMVGLNGRLDRNTTIGANVNLERSPMPLNSGSPWLTRSLFRVVRTLPTGASYSAATASLTSPAAGRGTGSVVGSVFVDWNANGIADAGEDMLEGIAMRVIPGSATATGHDGQFAFLSVPVGRCEVTLDTTAIPIDFDPPETASVELEISRGETRRVMFGLLPLGAIEGTVTRDANGNGKKDAGEEPVDGAVVILDGGARSEQVRGGRYRFDAVRSGDHTVKLLIESLPPGAQITGPEETTIALARGRMAAAVSFLVSIERRPEIRKVFPPKGGNVADASQQVRPSLVRAPSAPLLYTVQVAAVTDVDRARDIAIRLNATGVPAYVLEPGGDAWFRVRVGPYGSRSEAEQAATELGAITGSKLWVTRERQ